MKDTPRDHGPGQARASSDTRAAEERTCFSPDTMPDDIADGILALAARYEARLGRRGLQACPHLGDDDGTAAYLPTDEELARDRDP